jgi:hypothetical protein
MEGSKVLNVPTPAEPRRGIIGLAMAVEDRWLSIPSITNVAAKLDMLPL